MPRQAHPRGGVRRERRPACLDRRRERRPEDNARLLMEAQSGCASGAFCANVHRSGVLVDAGLAAGPSSPVSATCHRDNRGRPVWLRSRRRHRAWGAHVHRTCKGSWNHHLLLARRCQAGRPELVSHGDPGKRLVTAPHAPTVRTAEGAVLRHARRLRVVGHAVIRRPRAPPAADGA
jgi:hypothetical protein